MERQPTFANHLYRTGKRRLNMYHGEQKVKCIPWGTEGYKRTIRRNHIKCQWWLKNEMLKSFYLQVSPDFQLVSCWWFLFSAEHCKQKLTLSHQYCIFSVLGQFSVRARVRARVTARVRARVWVRTSSFHSGFSQALLVSLFFVINLSLIWLQQFAIPCNYR